MAALASGPPGAEEGDGEGAEGVGGADLPADAERSLRAALADIREAQRILRAARAG